MGAEDRVDRVRRAFEAAGIEDGNVLAVTSLDGRDVHIADIATHLDGDRSSVEIHLSGAAGGDPHFVIVNPPTLVPDPLGNVLVNGVRFREDPLRALAQVLADNGGAASIRKGRRGR